MLVDNPVKEVEMVRGDLLPFEELYKLHHRRVYAVCLRMTGNTAEAEDLSQEVFVQVFRKLDTFQCFLHSTQEPGSAVTARSYYL